MADVFISYSRKDQDFIRRLHKALAEINRDSWVDWEDIPLTAEWLNEIHDGIEKADTFVFVVSPDSVSSITCHAEIAHAVKHNKRVVPILRRPVPESEVPVPLRPINWIYFRESDDFTAKFRELIRALDTDLDWARAHTRLLVRAIEWDKKNQDDSLLLRGKDLREAEEWQSQSATGQEPRPTLLQGQYIIKSRRSETARQRTILGAVVVALAVTIGLALLALLQTDVANNARATAVAEADVRATAQAVAETRRQEADAQRLIAQARQLAAQSELIRVQEPSALSLSTLLAVESLLRHPALEGDQALRHDLNILPHLIAFKKNTPERSASSTLEISALAYSPDGHWLAMGDLTGTIRVWDTATWQEKWKVFFGQNGTVPAVRALAFSPDSRVLASGRDIGTQVWDAASGKPVAEMNDGDQVFSVSFSPDGRWLASGVSGTASVWETATGRQVSHVESDGELVRFSPDGKLVAAAGSGGSITVWDASTGQVLTRKEQIVETAGQADTSITTLTFSPDGQWIASGVGAPWFSITQPRPKAGGEILVWEAKTGKEIARLQHKDAVLSLAYSPDGKRLASGSFDTTAVVWDLKTGRKISEFSDGYPVDAIAFMDQGQRIVSSAWDGIARVWDANTGAEIARLSTESPAHIPLLAVNPDRNEVAVGDSAGGVFIWELLGAEQIKMEHAASVFSVAYSPEGKELLTASADKAVRVWDATTGRLSSRIDMDGAVVTAIYSPDGRYAAAGSLKGSVKVWQVSGGHDVLQIPPGQMVSSLAFSPDSRWLAIARGSYPRSGWNIFKLGVEDEASTVMVWDLSSGKEIAHLEHDSLVNSLAFSPDGKRLLTGTEDKIARVWDVSSGREVTRLYHKYRVNLVAFSPDGKWAASAESCFYVSFNKVPCSPVVRVWDPANAQVSWQSVQPAPWISNLVFSPDSRFLALGDSYVYGCPVENCDNTARVLDVTNGKEVSRMVHRGLVIAVAYSPDGKWIATGGGDKSLRIWNPTTGEEVSRIAGIEVWNVAFSPDGQRIAIGGYEEDTVSFVRVFPLRPQDLITDACSRLSRNLNRREWQQYIGAEPYRATCPNLPEAPPETSVDRGSSNDNPVKKTRSKAYFSTPSISADGRWVTFASDADDLVCRDTNRSTDVFLYDHQTQELTRISVAPDGSEASDNSDNPSISADGQYVVFRTDASNLGAGLVTYDRVKKELRALSLEVEGLPGPIRVSDAPSLSRDGQLVAFSGSISSTEQALLYDRKTGKTEIISRDLEGKLPVAGAKRVHVSGDGRFVSFESSAPNMVAGYVGPETGKVLIRDRIQARTTLASVGPDGNAPSGPYLDSSISGDGRSVAFISNLGETYQLYLRNLEGRQARMVSADRAGTPGDGNTWEMSLSADGRYLAYSSAARNLIDKDNNNGYNVFVSDSQTGQTQLISVNPDGTPIKDGSGAPFISEDGRYIAFIAGEMALSDGNSTEPAEILLWDRQTGKTSRIGNAAHCAK